MTTTRKPKRPRLAPRVKLHRNESTTVSGIDVRDLRDILTAASIHFYGVEKEQRESATKDTDNEIWLRRVHTVVKTLDASLQERIKETYSWHNLPPTTKQRWEAARQDKAFRLSFDELVGRIKSMPHTVKHV